MTVPNGLLQLNDIATSSIWHISYPLIILPLQHTQHFSQSRPSHQVPQHPVSHKPSLSARNTSLPRQHPQRSPSVSPAIVSQSLASNPDESSSINLLEAAQVTPSPFFSSPPPPFLLPPSLRFVFGFASACPCTRNQSITNVHSCAPCCRVPPLLLPPPPPLLLPPPGCSKTPKPSPSTWQKRPW